MKVFFLLLFAVMQQPAFTPRELAWQLLKVIDANDLEWARFLFAQGFASTTGKWLRTANPNAAGSPSRISPLHLAAHHGNLAACELLLDHGADVDSATVPHGFTPLHFALTEGYALSVASDNVGVRAAGPRPATVGSQHADVVRLLLARGANPEKATSCHLCTTWRRCADGKRRRVQEGRVSPLSIALASGNPELANLLLAADKRSRIPENGGRSPLFAAAAAGPDFTAELLARGMTCRPDRYGSTPLHLAVQAGSPGPFPRGMFDQLLPLADLAAVDENYHTPLSLAASRGDLAMMRALVERGAPLGSLGGLAESPLSCAVDGEHWAAARFLLERGADPNEGGPSVMLRSDLPPLVCAVRRGWGAGTRLLLAAGADPRLQSKKKGNATIFEFLSPCEWNAEGCVEVCEALLSASSYSASTFRKCLRPLFAVFSEGRAEGGREEEPAAEAADGEEPIAEAADGEEPTAEAADVEEPAAGELEEADGEEPTAGEVEEADGEEPTAGEVEEADGEEPAAEAEAADVEAPAELEEADVEAADVEEPTAAEAAAEAADVEEPADGEVEEDEEEDEEEGEDCTWGGGSYSSDSEDECETCSARKYVDLCKICGEEVTLERPDPFLRPLLAPKDDYQFADVAPARPEKVCEIVALLLHYGTIDGEPSEKDREKMAEAWRAWEPHAAEIDKAHDSLRARKESERRAGRILATALLDLHYRPGGAGYHSTKAHFEALAAGCDQKGSRDNHAAPKPSAKAVGSGAQAF